ncbi:MAG: outer membrane beta-barrel protein [Chthoniobacter sp.]|nr:outer membrane beta-barrel protein [Chthoniobacter sp.]
MRRSYRQILAHGILLGSCGFFAAAAIAAPARPAPSSNETPSAGAAEELDLERLGDTLAEDGAAHRVSADAAEPAVEPAPVEGHTTAPPAGRWHVAPHFDLRATYDDNIFITPHNQVEDVVIVASPGLRAGFWDYEEEMEGYLDRKKSATVLDRGGVGNFLVLDYTASLLGFVKTSSQNAVDQDARFETRWHWAKVEVGAKSQFLSTSTPDADVGGRVRRNTVTTELTASYQLSEKLSANVTLANVYRDPRGFTRSVEWRNEDYVDYQVTPLLHVAVGGAVGRVEVEDSADQVFERVLGRVTYEPTAKIGVRLNGGVEFRQSDGAVGDRVDPVFSAELRYAPAEETLLALRGFRQLEISASRPDQVYTNTGVELRFERMLRTGWHLAVGGGYSRVDYSASSGVPSREDDFFFAEAGLIYNFAHWGNVGLNYEYRQDDSTNPSSSFENSRVTLQVGLSF